MHWELELNLYSGKREVIVLHVFSGNRPNQGIGCIRLEDLLVLLGVTSRVPATAADQLGPSTNLVDVEEDEPKHSRELPPMQVLLDYLDAVLI